MYCTCDASLIDVLLRAVLYLALIKFYKVLAAVSSGELEKETNSKIKLEKLGTNFAIAIAE